MRRGRTASYTKHLPSSQIKKASLSGDAFLLRKVERLGAAATPGNEEEREKQDCGREPDHQPILLPRYG